MVTPKKPTSFNTEKNFAKSCYDDKNIPFKFLLLGELAKLFNVQCGLSMTSWEIYFFMEKHTSLSFCAQNDKKKYPRRH